VTAIYHLERADLSFTKVRQLWHVYFFVQLFSETVLQGADVSNDQTRQQNRDEVQ
jgi:hypothetical protein